jgi:hypothetical protein
MAKQGGMGYAVSVDDSTPSLRVISNDVTNFQFATPRGVQDVTGVDKSAIERLLLLADFSITLNGVFDVGANLAHAVFKTVPSTSVLRTVTLAVSSQTLSNETLFTDYALTRAQDGSLVWTAPGVLGDGTVPTWS